MQSEGHHLSVPERERRSLVRSRGGRGGGEEEAGRAMFSRTFCIKQQRVSRYIGDFFFFFFDKRETNYTMKYQYNVDI